MFFFSDDKPRKRSTKTKLNRVQKQIQKELEKKELAKAQKQLAKLKRGR